MFRCRTCGPSLLFDDVYKVLAHLRKQHRQLEDKEEAELVQNEMVLPSDLRRVFCIECIKEGRKNGERGEWLCQDLEGKKDLKGNLLQLSSSCIFYCTKTVLRDTSSCLVLICNTSQSSKLVLFLLLLDS